MNYRNLEPKDDTAIAKIIRKNLEKVGLNIPGTAYFDKELDHLSAYYGCAPEKRAYFVALDENGSVSGGVGIAEFPLFDGCAELQKLYLSDGAKGKGFGRALAELALQQAGELGYRRVYLETHTCLGTAVHLYEKLGFRQIDRPSGVLHSAMNLFFLKEL